MKNRKAIAKLFALHENAKMIYRLLMSINLKLNVLKLLKLQLSTKNCTSTALKYFIPYSNRIPIINIYFEQYIQKFVQL